MENIRNKINHHRPILLTIIFVVFKANEALTSMAIGYANIIEGKYNEELLYATYLYHSFMKLKKYLYVGYSDHILI